MIKRARIFIPLLLLIFLVSGLYSALASESKRKTATSSKSSAALKADRSTHRVTKNKLAKSKHRRHKARLRAASSRPRPVLDGRLVDDSPSSGLRRRLSARSAIVIDAQTGETLYAHSPDLPGQPASTLKVLTGLLAINHFKGSEMVEVSKRAALMPSSKVFLQPGSNYRANDLINAVLLASANDASVALAEKIAGSEDVFARLMTTKARALGASNTECKNATGLTAMGQKSTARDLATIFRTAMNDKAFSKRMALITYKTTDGKVLRNHNKALWRMDCADGGKTGYTLAARQTYVGKFSRANKDVIVALLGSETMWLDIRNLVNYGFAVGRDHESTSASTKAVGQAGQNKVGNNDKVPVSQQVADIRAEYIRLSKL